MILTISGFAAEKCFKDVPAGSWYSASVAFVSKKGYMDGISEDRFDPKGKVSRAQIAQILYAMEGKPDSNKVLFPDAPAGKWFSNAVNWAGASGIVSGYKNGNFGPEDPVTRQQLTAILFKYAEMKDYEITAREDISSFKDANKVSAYAKEPMKWAVSKKLISGTNIGLEPAGTATRAQLAVILQAFDENVAGKDSEQSSDTAENGQVPYIGDNGNWWIDDQDTGIAATGKDGKDGADGKDGTNGKDGKDGVDGKDGQTPYIGDNGNWWINGKDTGTAATASVKKQMPGDAVEFINECPFEWTSENNEKIVIDSVNIKYYGETPFEPGNSNPAKRINGIPEDTTYAERGVQSFAWRPNLYRINIKGHMDRAYAGRVIEIDLGMMDDDGTRFYMAYVKNDGSFEVVAYQTATIITSMYFYDAYLHSEKETDAFLDWLKPVS